LEWPIADRLGGPPGASISDVVIEALSGDLESGIGLLSVWTPSSSRRRSPLLASARSLQIGDGMAVFPVT
jgi:hypothetical protein